MNYKSVGIHLIVRHIGVEAHYSEEMLGVDLLEFFLSCSKYVFVVFSIDNAND